MKYIKLYEQYVAGKYDAVALTDNEKRFLKTKGFLKEVYLFSNDPLYVFDFCALEKIIDNFYIVNYKTKCSSLRDVIKYIAPKKAIMDKWFQEKIDYNNTLVDRPKNQWFNEAGKIIFSVNEEKNKFIVSEELVIESDNYGFAVFTLDMYITYWINNQGYYTLEYEF